MPDVYVRFRTDPVFRTMANDEGDINLDLDSAGNLVGVELRGAMSVEIDGQAVNGTPADGA